MIKSRKYNQGETSSFSSLKARCLSAALPISAAVAIMAGLLLIAHKPARADAVEDQQKLTVLFLGDSLALCGFGKRLDERFRNDPKVKATFSYMACGTNPLSWLKYKPYEKVKTLCGYWAIESAQRSNQPKETIDIYGTKRNQAPKAHPVPKLEEMITAMQPDIIVIQTGSNLFGLFPDGKTVHPARDAATLKKYLIPFKQTAISGSSNVRKIYYVNPPTSGRVGKEVQDFVFEQTKQQLSSTGIVIDSRTLVSYPYRHMEPDKEHFVGAQMDEWADKVFDIVQRDLSAQPLAALKPLRETDAAAIAEPVPPAEGPQTDPLVVNARLVFKSKPMQLKELMPYRESLVAYVYDLKRVIAGRYSEKQVLVMHPSCISMKPQPLENYRLGATYKLRLEPVAGTMWDTAKSRDESGLINLEPYVRVEDKLLHPGSRAR